MKRTSTIVLLAGVALGNVAFAQSNADRAYTAELMADAEGRTSLLRQSGAAESGVPALRSADGNFSLKIGGLVQARYVADFRRKDNAAGATQVVGPNDNFTHGFEMNETRISFTGNVVNPDLTYAIGWGFNSSGSASLDDAYINYAFSNGVSLRAGQFKLPILTEELVGWGQQQAVDRSTTNNFFFFSQGWSQGLQLGYRSEQFQGRVAFSDGVRTQNTPFNSAAESDYALTGRADLKLSGDWKQFDQFSSWQGAQTASLIGAAFHWQNNGGTGDGVDGTPAAKPANTAKPGVGLFLWTVDAQIKGGGWNIFGALIGSIVDPNATSTGTGTAAVNRSTNNLGVVLQGGFFATSQLEFFARWDAIFADKKNGTGGNELTSRNFHFLTLGGNYYVAPESQAAKLTTDLVFSFSKTSNLRGNLFSGSQGGTSAPGFGAVLPDAESSVRGSGKSPEIALRVQFQLMF